MPFTFSNPRKLDVDEVSPFGGILQNALKSYNDITKSQYLEPNLVEALKKARLYNQYYGQDMQSQANLRGAEASHYGALTAGQNINNQWLPEKLRQEVEKLKQAAQEKAFFNAMLQRKLAAQGQSQQGVNTPSTDLSSYAMGQGMPPYNPDMGAQTPSSMPNQPSQQMGMSSQPQNSGMQQQNTSMQQPSMPAQSPRTQNAEDETAANPYFQDLSQQESEPQPTADDLLNKHFFKTDTFTPKLQAYVEQKKAIKEKTNTELMNIQKEAPILLDSLKDTLYIQKKIDEDPEWFGPGILGKDIYGPSYRERRVTNKEHGVLTGKFNKIVGRAALQLSSKPLAAALKTTIANKVNFGLTPAEAAGRTQEVTEDTARALKNADDFTYAKTGKHILGSVDRKLIQQAFDSLETNKVNVYFGGKKHRVPRSQVDKFRGKKGVRIEE